MKKLALELDMLRVESFDTSPAKSGSGGTVQAHQGSYNTCNETNYTCVGTCQYTCAYSCNGTCHQSCNGTCYEPSCNGTCPGQNTCGGIVCVPF